MVAWPGSLPQYAYLPVSETRQSATLRSNMESGPPKVRRRFTAAMRHLDFDMAFDGTQKATFDTFFNTTLSEGAVSFDFPDPVSGNTIGVRFREPVSWQQTQTGATSAERSWRGKMKLEVLP